MEGRRRARAGSADPLVESGFVLVLPDFRAGVGVVADDQFLVAELLLREKPIAYDGERRPSRADAMTPNFFGGILRPVRVDSDAAELGIAVGAAKARPIARLQDQHCNGSCFIFRDGANLAACDVRTVVVLGAL